MRHWLIHWILKSVSLLIVARILPGIEVDGFFAAFIPESGVKIADLRIVVVSIGGLFSGCRGRGPAAWGIL